MDPKPPVIDSRLHASTVPLTTETDRYYGRDPGSQDRQRGRARPPQRVLHPRPIPVTTVSSVGPPFVHIHSRLRRDPTGVRSRRPFRVLTPLWVDPTAPPELPERSPAPPPVLHTTRVPRLLTAVDSPGDLRKGLRSVTRSTLPSSLSDPIPGLRVRVKGCRRVPGKATDGPFVPRSGAVLSQRLTRDSTPWTTGQRPTTSHLPVYQSSRG